MFKRILLIFLILWLSGCSTRGVKHFFKHKKAKTTHVKTTHVKKRRSSRRPIVVYKRKKITNPEDAISNDEPLLVKRTIHVKTYTPNQSVAKIKRSIFHTTPKATKKSVKKFVKKQTRAVSQTRQPIRNVRKQKSPRIIEKKRTINTQQLKRKKQKKLNSLLKKFAEEDRRSRLALQTAENKAAQKRKSEKKRLFTEDAQSKQVAEETRQRYLRKMKESTEKVIHKQEVQEIETEAALLLIQKQRETARLFKEKQVAVVRKMKQQSHVKKKVLTEHYSLSKLSQGDVFGTSEIHGRVLITNHIGAKIPLNQTKAYLVPKSHYHGGNSFSYSTATNVNAQGKFSFFGFPNEKYYIIIKSKSTANGGNIYIKRELDFSRKNVINMVFRKNI